MRMERLFQACKNYKATLAIIAIWLVLYILDRRLGLRPALEGRGLDLVQGEFYRYATGPLLHFNLPHLLINAVTMFWVGYYMEASVGSVRLFLFGLAAGTLAELAYVCIFRSSQQNIGGSVWIFAYIGLIIACRLWRPGFPRFRMGTWYGNWIAAYAVLGNIPVMSFMDGGTVVIHLLSLLIGGALAAAALLLR